MRLHEDKEAFADLCTVTAEFIGIPEVAVRRDYFIVMMLQMLEGSPYAEKCVFKGGTSLSKCYPGSISRFSEDIDLTFLPDGDMGNKQRDKMLKNIEKVMSEGAFVEKIPDERSSISKSLYVWFEEEGENQARVKLEIGSSVRPDPYQNMELKSYIQDYLESKGMEDVAEEYGLVAVRINTLAIERIFLDKVMSVKRHAVCGTLEGKVRHIYDVTVLLEREDIQSFLSNGDELKELLQKTKNTDSYYLEKRNIDREYDPLGPYDFPSWEKHFDKGIRARYESLHEDLLYTDERQDFDKALKAFRIINEIFESIGE